MEEFYSKETKSSETKQRFLTIELFPSFQFVLLFELIIPLVLFLVMTAIRKTQQTSFHPQSSFSTSNRIESKMFFFQRITHRIFSILLIEPNLFHRRAFFLFYNRFVQKMFPVTNKVSVFFPMERKENDLTLKMENSTFCFSSFVQIDGNFDHNRSNISNESIFSTEFFDVRYRFASGNLRNDDRSSGHSLRFTRQFFNTFNTKFIDFLFISNDSTEFYSTTM